MSELMSILQNIELITLNKINLISNMQIQAKYENAEYKSFIKKILGIIMTQKILIYTIYF